MRFEGCHISTEHPGLSKSMVRNCCLLLPSAAASVEQAKPQAAPASRCMHLVAGREPEVNEMKDWALCQKNNSFLQVPREPSEMGSLVLLESPCPPRSLLPSAPSLQPSFAPLPPSSPLWVTSERPHTHAPTPMPRGSSAFLVPAAPGYSPSPVIRGDR